MVAPSASATLVCHRGAREVTRDELSRVGCPPPQGRWRPVPHAQVLGYAEHALTAAGYAVDKASLALSKDHARFFGTLTLRTPVAHGVNLAVGLRSSTDESLLTRRKGCCGSRVYVCDNLAFSAQTVVARAQAHDPRDRPVSRGDLQGRRGTVRLPRVRGACASARCGHGSSPISKLSRSCAGPSSSASSARP